jgi:hypothetical protein
MGKKGKILSEKVKNDPIKFVKKAMVCCGRALIFDMH